MADILMAEARVHDLNGKILYLQPEGDRLMPGHQYFREPFDRGKTFCPCCTVPVVYRSPTQTTSGSSFRGRRGHFALAPGKKHDEGCDILTRPRAERHLVPDRTKGFRIHINTRSYSETFNDKTGVYERDAKGRIVITDPDLIDRERKVINTAEELADFLKTADIARIRDSKVIFRNRSLPWDDFFVYPQANRKNERYGALVSRLLELPKGEETFCALVMTVHKPGSVTYRHRVVHGQQEQVFRLGKGTREYVKPQIKVKDMKNTHLTHGFLLAGDYLIMGVPKFWQPDDPIPNQYDYFVQIPAHNPDAVAKIDLQDVLDIRRKKGRAVDAPQQSP